MPWKNREQATANRCILIYFSSYHTVLFLKVTKRGANTIPPVKGTFSIHSNLNACRTGAQVSFGVGGIHNILYSRRLKGISRAFLPTQSQRNVILQFLLSPPPPTFSFPSSPPRLLMSLSRCGGGEGERRAEVKTGRKGSWERQNCPTRGRCRTWFGRAMHFFLLQEENLLGQPVTSIPCRLVIFVAGLISSLLLRPRRHEEEPGAVGGPQRLPSSVVVTAAIVHCFTCGRTE